MTTNPGIVRLVVVAIIGVVMVSLVAIIALTLRHQTVPQLLGHAFDVGFGALATLLASTRSSTEAPQDVTVVNKPADPVPVDAG